MIPDTGGTKPNLGILLAVLADAESPPGQKREACEKLWRCCAPRMLRWAAADLHTLGDHGLAPEDVVDEVFVRLLARGMARTFQAGRSPWPWLRQVVRNQVRDMLRGERRHGRHRSLEHLSSSAPGQAPDEQLMGREECKAALARLSGEERTLFVSCYLDGRAPRVLAAERNQDRRWVYTRLRRAREKMRRFVAAQRLDDSRASK
jgi:RNA polymerase sigma factor (sigma-70 family)